MHEHSHEHHIQSDMTAEELLALLEYNYTHNSAHASQMEEMLTSLKKLGNTAAAEKLQEAVAKYSEANALLKEAIEELK